MTREEAIRVLEGGDFDAFIDVAESVEVEFKGEPYQVDIRDSQKFELAKDVSAFANASGGVIIVGAQTEPGDVAAVDIVRRLRPLRQADGLLNEQSYEGIVDDMVYPRVSGFSVRFYPSAEAGDRGLYAIDVPPQRDSDKYFLIQRPAVDGVDRTPSWLIGLAVRGIGRVEVRRIGEIHSLISRGLDLGARVSDLVESIAELREEIAGGAAPAPETPADRLESKIDARINEVS